MQHTKTTVALNTATLAFSGTGHVLVPAGFYVGGDNTVTGSTGLFLSVATLFHFTAPSDVWVYDTVGNGSIIVLSWY